MVGRRSQSLACPTLHETEPKQEADDAGREAQFLEKSRDSDQAEKAEKWNVFRLVSPQLRRVGRCDRRTHECNCVHRPIAEKRWFSGVPEKGLRCRESA
jgi:hypothetical protein